jgi:ferric-dicitrate binding protein FerR (iron transport regulator)
VHSASKMSAVLILVVCSAAMLTAQTSGAMLYATGNVTLNGASVQKASSIFSGDRLVTSSSSMVSVNRSGSSVVLKPNSAIQYKKSAIELVDGTAHVRTVNGMSAEVGNITIAPKDGSAEFDVARVNNQVVVTSIQGNVAVNDGGHTTMLQPGNHTTVALASAAGSGSAHSGNGPFIHQSAIVASGPFYSLMANPNDLPWCPSVGVCRPGMSSHITCKCPIP